MRVGIENALRGPAGGMSRGDGEKHGNCVPHALTTLVDHAGCADMSRLERKGFRIEALEASERRVICCGSLGMGERV